MRNVKFNIFLLALFLISLPMSALAITGSTYEIDPASGTSSVHHSVSGGTYSIEGSLGAFAGSVSGTTYTVESGDAFQYYCGDGFIDPGESCEGSDLGGATCVSRGFSSGTLSCSSTCSYVTTSCVSAGGGGGGGGSSTTTTTKAKPSAPTVSSEVPSDFSYKSSLSLYGVKDSTADSVKVNSSTTGVTYPTSTSWQVSVSLSYRMNTFKLVATNSGGDSLETLFDLYRRLIGDVNEDDTVNDYDLSKFVKLWGGSDRNGDFNEDTNVNDYDFSMLVSRWGTSV